MNFFTKSRLLVGAIVVLLALNLATWATIAYNRHREKARMEAREQRDHDHDHGKGRGRGLGQLMARELNLTAEQEAAVHELRAQYHRQVKPIREQLGAGYHAMMLELGAESPSPVRLDSIARAIGELHYQHQLATIAHFKDVRAVCTPEQQAKLQALYQRMAPKIWKHSRRGGKGWGAGHERAHDSPGRPERPRPGEAR